jgi:hypothetical protein
MIVDPALLTITNKKRNIPRHMLKQLEMITKQIVKSKSFSLINYRWFLHFPLVQE